MTSFLPPTSANFPTDPYDFIAALAGTDIYLLDQIMKQRFPAGCSVLDAGCGGGRNLKWFMRSGYGVAGVDTSAAAISSLRADAAGVAPDLPPDSFRVEHVENLTFADSSFDAVLSIAVLHFAQDAAHFGQMLDGMWRVLRPGGTFFARLASSIGIESLISPVGNGRYHLPDGSIRFLVSMEDLLQHSGRLGGTLLEPIKTVNVQNLRCMTTWVLRKD